MTDEGSNHIGKAITNGVIGTAAIAAGTAIGDPSLILTGLGNIANATWLSIEAEKKGRAKTSDEVDVIEIAHIVNRVSTAGGSKRSYYERILWKMLDRAWCEIDISPTDLKMLEQLSTSDMLALDFMANDGWKDAMVKWKKTDLKQHIVALKSGSIRADTEVLRRIKTQGNEVGNMIPKQYMIDWIEDSMESSIPFNSSELFTAMISRSSNHSDHDLNVPLFSETKNGEINALLQEDKEHISTFHSIEDLPIPMFYTNLTRTGRRIGIILRTVID